MATKKTARSKEKVVRRVRARDEDIDSNDVIDPSPNRKMPWFGWLGLAIMVVSEITLWGGFRPVAIAFTPLMWTGYILLIDGWIWMRGYRSYFRDDKLEWPMLALFSILIWVMFEVFNFSVQAWWYENRPENMLVRGIVFAWAYATIIPALLRTRSLFATFKFFDRTHPWNFKVTPFGLAISFIVGIAFTFIPVMFGHATANVLVPLVWLGFIFLIEPINYRIGAPSVFRDLEEGKVSFFWQILFAGLFCGLLWETWNKQADWNNGLIWKYHLADIYLLGGVENPWRIGNMPVLGFLGYPPFIWECFALWEVAKWAMHGETLFKFRQARSNLRSAAIRPVAVQER
jgi:hypothetical protein